jgi:hypothetical protein
MGLIVNLDDLVHLKRYSIVNRYSATAGIMRDTWMDAVILYESFHGSLGRGN